ncbi:MAG: hypothetical protein GVY36_01225 [Verrucomicrobia bacterium]|jgi:hypothetical protein|nr:hypothetical protein [Verrucomicrobiota bacterium]
MPLAQKQVIPPWQWPNVLGIDAAFISVLWQGALASTIGVPLSLPAYLVLGCSVWLSYTADRLFDVARRPSTALLSVRHRFAKRRRILLWRVWFGVLALNLITATQLSSFQLKQGSVLLLLCVLYTWLNQKLSRHYFPKELCVALIYTGGIVVFLPEPPSLTFVFLFTYLCLLNCLMIGAKETSVDAQLRIRSLASGLRASYLSPLIWLGAIAAFFIETPLSGALTVSCILLAILNAWRQHIAVEVFRVLADGLLLIGPILVLMDLTG